MNKVFIIALVLVALILVGCQSQRTTYARLSGDRLVVGTGPMYPPYTQRNVAGNIVGYDMDVLTAMAEKLGKKIELVPMEFDALVLALKQGKIDLIVAGISITPSRQREMIMIPYQNLQVDHLLLGFWNQAPFSVENRLVAVDMGTFQADYLDGMTGVKKKYLEGVAEVVMDLKYKKADAALFEPNTAKKVSVNHPQLQFQTITLDEPVLGVGICVVEPKLAEQVEEAISKMQESGELSELEAKWF